MTDSEIMFLDSQFWISNDMSNISFPPNATNRANELYLEWECYMSCKFEERSWFALLLSEVLK